MGGQLIGSFFRSDKFSITDSTVDNFLVATGILASCSNNIFLHCLISGMADLCHCGDYNITGHLGGRNSQPVIFESNADFLPVDGYGNVRRSQCIALISGKVCSIIGTVLRAAATIGSNMCAIESNGVLLRSPDSIQLQIISDGNGCTICIDHAAAGSGGPAFKCMSNLGKAIGCQSYLIIAGENLIHSDSHRTHSAGGSVAVKGNNRIGSLLPDTVLDDVNVACLSILGGSVAAVLIQQLNACNRDECGDNIDVLLDSLIGKAKTQSFLDFGMHRIQASY